MECPCCSSRAALLARCDAKINKETKSRPALLSVMLSTSSSRMGCRESTATCLAGTCSEIENNMEASTSSAPHHKFRAAQLSGCLDVAAVPAACRDELTAPSSARIHDSRKSKTARQVINSQMQAGDLDYKPTTSHRERRCRSGPWQPHLLRLEKRTT